MWRDDATAFAGFCRPPRRDGPRQSFLEQLNRVALPLADALQFPPERHMSAPAYGTTPATSSPALLVPTPAAPHELLRDMTTGWVLTRGLQCVADLGVADALDDTPQAAATLAAMTGAHPQALERTL